MMSVRDRLLQTITHVATTRAVAALTFDDGPDPVSTPRLLDILWRHGAKATFFMLGQAAARHPEIVWEARQAGHVIGNHTWDHPSLPTLGRAARVRQILRAARALRPHAVRLFRPPYGDQTATTALEARLLGYRSVTWSVDGGDWSGQNTQSITERLCHRIRPGDIVVLHDGLITSTRAHADRTPTLDAVELLLERMRGRMRFVTVPELLRTGIPHLEPWYRIPTDRAAPRPQDLRWRPTP